MMVYLKPGSRVRGGKQRRNKAGGKAETWICLKRKKSGNQQEGDIENSRGKRYGKPVLRKTRKKRYGKPGSMWNKIQEIMWKMK